MGLKLLQKNQYLRSLELQWRIDKCSRNVAGPIHGAQQPEHLSLEELDAKLVREIVGVNAWELSEEEFVELASSQDRYACFMDITALWHRLIIDGIDSGEAKEINAEGLSILAWRGVSEINAAYKAKFGVYLWEPGTGITEPTGEPDTLDTEDEPEENTLPKFDDMDGQLYLF